jgi:hypothetical protein
LNSKIVFSTLILQLILVLGLGWALWPTRAAVLDPPAAKNSPHDLQAPQAGGPQWNLLYLDGMQEQVNIGSNISLAFDLISDTPYISYYNHQTQNLVLASPARNSNCGGKWWCRESTPKAMSVWEVRSLFMFGFPRWMKLGISYYDATNKRLRFAQWSCS